MVLVRSSTHSFVRIDVIGCTAGTTTDQTISDRVHPRLVERPKERATNPEPPYRSTTT